MQAVMTRRVPQAVLAGEVAPDLETWVVMHEDQRALRRVRLAFDHLVRALKACSTIHIR
jgi:hypothetical protein